MENSSVLDFTSPGSIPLESSEVIKQVHQEIRISIQTLENILVTDPMETTCWKLLGGLYLGADLTAKFKKLANQYKNLFGKPLFPEFEEKNYVEERIVFKIPPNISPELLPDIAAVEQACSSHKKVLIDFSDVKESSSEGLNTLATFFLSLVKVSSNKPEIIDINHFILDLEKKAITSSKVNNMWDVLFAYKRLCNDVKEFDNLALKFAIQYSISPPSWT